MGEREIILRRQFIKNFIYIHCWVWNSKTVIFIFLKDPEGYSTKKSNGIPQKISDCQDTWWSSTHIKAITGAYWSPATIKWHLQKKAL